MPGSSAQGLQIGILLLVFELRRGNISHAGKPENLPLYPPASLVDAALNTCRACVCLFSLLPSFEAMQLCLPSRLSNILSSSSLNLLFPVLAMFPKARTHLRGLKIDVSSGRKVQALSLLPALPLTNNCLLILDCLT